MPASGRGGRRGPHGARFAAHSIVSRCLATRIALPSFHARRHVRSVHHSGRAATPHHQPPQRHTAAASVTSPSCGPLPLPRVPKAPLTLPSHTPAMFRHACTPAVPACHPARKHIRARARTHTHTHLVLTYSSACCIASRGARSNLALSSAASSERFSSPACSRAGARVEACMHAGGSALGGEHDGRGHRGRLAGSRQGRLNAARQALHAWRPARPPAVTGVMTAAHNNTRVYRSAVNTDRPRCSVLLHASKPCAFRPCGHLWPCRLTTTATATKERAWVTG